MLFTVIFFGGRTTSTYSHLMWMYVVLLCDHARMHTTCMYSYLCNNRNIIFERGPFNFIAFLSAETIITECARVCTKLERFHLRESVVGTINFYALLWRHIHGKMVHNQMRVLTNPKIMFITFSQGSTHSPVQGVICSTYGISAH